MENRGSVRTPYETDVCVSYKDNFWHGTSKDISVGGMFINSNSFPALESEIVLIFDFVDYKAEIKSVVRWIGKSGFGVQFITPSVRDVHEINKIFKDGREEDYIEIDETDLE